MNLLSQLNRQAGSRICLANSKQQLSVAMLQAESIAFRQDNSQLADSAVVLNRSHAFDLIRDLVSLDGFAVSVYLGVPQGARYARGEFRLDDSGVSKSAAASGVETVKNKTATKWLMYTSGTTGAPKEIEHSFASLTRTIRTDQERGGGLRWGLLYAPSRFAGLQMVLQSLLGGSLLYVPDQIDIAGQCKEFADFGVNALSATPSMWRKLLMVPEAAKLPLQQITLGGEVADANVLQSLSSRYPAAKITHIYASTEAGVGFSVKDKRAGFPAEWINSSVGGVDLNISSEGTLLVRHSTLAKGQEIDGRVDSGGYLDTEDRVEIRDDRVIFLGRDSGAINVGGNKVHPEEVEAVIRQYPGVLEVRVSGKRNPIIGELVTASISLEENDRDQADKKREILKFCQDRLPRHKVPALLTFVEEFELAESGKLART